MALVLGFGSHSEGLLRPNHHHRKGRGRQASDID